MTKRTQVLVKLPDHKFLYTGINPRRARAARVQGLKDGWSVTTKRSLVTGSLDLFHYTVTGVK